MIKKISTLTVCLMLCAKSSMGAGFALFEYSTSNLARGFAGMGVAGDDYSAIVANPAGMTLMGDGVQGGLSVINVRAEATSADDASQNAKVDIVSPVPFLFAQTSLSDKAKFGAAFYVPYGLGTEYDDDWYGRNHALMSEVVVYDLTFSGSYDLTDKFTVGASLSTQYATAELTNDADAPLDVNSDGVIDTLVPSMLHSEIEGDSDVSLAYTLGLLYRPTEDTRFGLSYRSKSHYDLEGSHSLTYNANPVSLPVGAVYAEGDARASITLPEHILLSAYHKMGKFGLAAGAKWTRWGRFKNLDVYSDVNGLNRTEENWKNTWSYSLGMDYDLNEKWVLRTGVQYDETGISSVDHRTARIPDNDRIITGLGASYKFDGGQVDMAYAHIFLDDNYANYEGLNSDYSMAVDMISVALQYHF